jgi:hypothetical protein
VYRTNAEARARKWSAPAPSLANKKEMQDPVRNRACDPASGAHRFVVVKAVCGRVVTGFVPERLRKQRFCVQENVKRIAVQRIDLLSGLGPKAEWSGPKNNKVWQIKN